MNGKRIKKTPIQLQQMKHNASANLFGLSEDHIQRVMHILHAYQKIWLLWLFIRARLTGNDRSLPPAKSLAL